MSSELHPVQDIENLFKRQVRSNYQGFHGIIIFNASQGPRFRLYASPNNLVSKGRYCAERGTSKNLRNMDALQGYPLAFTTSGLANPRKSDTSFRVPLLHYPQTHTSPETNWAMVKLCPRPASGQRRLRQNNQVATPALVARDSQTSWAIHTAGPSPYTSPSARCLPPDSQFPFD
ncbi:hypothetical protein F4604DRAFT_1688670 [Suillus subluteus]|nr:hypothetical protein F4604DRAFT_1688670 [Suillus subluteus]